MRSKGELATAPAALRQVRGTRTQTCDKHEPQTHKHCLPEVCVCIYVFLGGNGLQQQVRQGFKLYLCVCVCVKEQQLKTHPQCSPVSLHTHTHTRHDTDSFADNSCRSPINFLLPFSQLFFSYTLLHTHSLTLTHTPCMHTLFSTCYQRSVAFVMAEPQGVSVTQGLRRPVVVRRLTAEKNGSSG